MVALVDAIGDGRIPNAEIAVVISDHPEARGLVKARDRGIETVAIKRSGRTREEHDRESVAALRHLQVDLVCLVGYMRVLSGAVLKDFPRRPLNIHPSLLP